MNNQAWLLAVMMLLMSSAQADPAAAPVAGFNPSQIKAMRAVGQAVLAAKKIQTTDPALIELRQGVEELRALAKEQLAPTAGGVQGKIELQPLPPPTPPAESSQDSVIAQAVTAQQTTRQAKAITVLAKIGERRARAASLLATQQDRGESPQIAEEAAARLAALGEELETALAEAPELRLQRLSQIKQRLEPKRMREMQVENNTPGLQPTLSTRVTHVAPIRLEPAIQSPKPSGMSKRLKVTKPNAKSKRP